MPNMIVLKGVEARDALIRGANFLADAVKSTIGPFGANAYLEKGDKITNDGKTIAHEIWLKNEIENRGAHLLRQAATKTDDRVGDGTTTATTLGQAIIKSAVRHLPSDKRVIGDMTGIEVINQIESECKEVCTKLSAMAEKITSEQQLIDVATVSVEDRQLGTMIGKAQFALGPDGVLLAEDSNDAEHSIKTVNGIRIDNGFSTSLIAFDPATQSLITPKTRVLLTNHVLPSLNSLAPIIKQLASQKWNNLTIIARGFGSQAMKEALDYTNAGFAIYPINAPYTDQNEIMKDLVAVFGGRYINTEVADLNEIMITDIGSAEKIVARRWDSIMTGEENPTAEARVKGRITEISKQLGSSESDFEKKHLQTRIAQLKSGFAIVKVGGSLARRKYLLDKATDAVNSVRNAFQEGVVPGAGQALLKISEEMTDTSILKPALRSVYDQIISSAPKGFEIPAWVKDPVKVIRVALEEACAVAGVFSTALIATAQERPKPKYVQEADNNEDNV